jgi:hypothetical protein
LLLLASFLRRQVFLRQIPDHAVFIVGRSLRMCFSAFVRRTSPRMIKGLHCVTSHQNVEWLRAQQDQSVETTDFGPTSLRLRRGCLPDLGANQPADRQPTSLVLQGLSAPYSFLERDAYP